MINEYIALGQDTLSELSSQKERLKSVQRKVRTVLYVLPTLHLALAPHSHISLPHLTLTLLRYWIFSTTSDCQT